jgi:hypothetical protein
MAPPKGPPPASAFAVVGRTLSFVAAVAAVLFACHSAFTIRTFAIDNYGRLIHECVARGARSAARSGGARRARNWRRTRPPFF